MEIYLRTANIIKFASMVMFIVALLLVYAFVPGQLRLSDIPFSAETMMFSKGNLFYWGLGLFIVVNVLAGLTIYYIKKQTSSVKKLSLEKILFWLSLTISGMNFFLLLIFSFVGFINVEGVSNPENYRFLPVVGVIILLFSLLGLIVTLFRIRQTI